MIPDRQRIAQLPRRRVPTDDITHLLAKPGCAQRLRPMQSAVLSEVSRLGGAVGALSVGEGKAWLTVLIPAIANARLGIVLAPKGTLKNLKAEMAELNKHFRLAPIAFLSYGKLSRPRFLPDGRPDPMSMLDVLAHGLREDEVVLVADEAHRLANIGKSSTVAKVEAFLHRHDKHGVPDPNQRNGRRFVPLSGTIDELKVEKFAHLYRWALGAGSPLPTNKHDLESWSNILDYKGTPHAADWSRFGPVWSSIYPGSDILNVPHTPRQSPRKEAAAKAFRYRMRVTPGVVMSSPETQQALPDVELYKHRPDVDPSVVKHMTTLMTDDTLPNQDLVETSSEKWIRMRQLAVGFYPKLEWPDGVDLDWLRARKEWHRHVRAVLDTGRVPGRDSPATLRAQVEWELRTWLPERREPIHNALARWLPHCKKPEPARPPQWYSSWVIDWTLRFLSRQHRPVIVWADDEALQRAFENHLTVYGANTHPEEAEHAEHAVLSMDAHFEGKNLQYNRATNRGLWADMLILTPRPSGKRIEQTIGRVVRTKQPAPICNIHFLDVPWCFAEANAEAVKQARHIESMHGTPQKMNHGTWKIPVFM